MFLLTLFIVCFIIQQTVSEAVLWLSSYSSIAQLVGNTPLLHLQATESKKGLSAALLAQLPDTGERYLSTLMFQ